MTPQECIDMAKRHRAHDMLASGHFEMREGQACSVGCFCHDLGLPPNDFAGLSGITGIPEAAHRLQDVIFEGLPKGEREEWHIQFFEKAAAVKDWQRVIDETVLAALKIALPHDTQNVVQPVIDLYQRRLNGDDASRTEWQEAARAARAAAADVARAAARAARAAAADVARAAAWAAWAAAADAARAAARAARAARAAAWAAWAARDAWAAAADAACREIRDTFLGAEA